MGISKYRLINENKNKGVWLNTQDLIQLIKLCDKRNATYKKKLVEMYEFLEEETFKEEWIRAKRY